MAIVEHLLRSLVAPTDQELAMYISSSICGGNPMMPTYGRGSPRVDYYGTVARVKFTWSDGTRELSYLVTHQPNGQFQVIREGFYPYSD